MSIASDKLTTLTANSNKSRNPKQHNHPVIKVAVSQDLLKFFFSGHPGPPVVWAGAVTGCRCQRTTLWRGATRGETSVRSRGYTGTAHHHYGLPPPGQQHGGADPPHAEGSPVHPRGGRCLKESPAQGLAGHAGCSQGGVRYVGHRGSPTAAAGGAWSATVTQWAASWRGETSGTAGGHTAHRALLRPGGDFITPRWDGPGLQARGGAAKLMSEKYSSHY